MTDETQDVTLAAETSQPKPKRKTAKKARVAMKKAKPKARKPSKKTAKKAVVKGKGKFKRTCKLPGCGVKFATDDKRKVFHSRACGNKARSGRWYRAAAAALRKQRKKSK